MQRLIDVVANNLPAFSAGGTQMAAGFAGLAGMTPEGVHPLAYLLLSFGGPIVTAIAWRILRTGGARRRARLIAHAAELRRCAQEHEAAAQRLLLDADSSNDETALKLQAQARLERIEAAADDGEAAQIEQEMARR